MCWYSFYLGISTVSIRQFTRERRWKFISHAATRRNYQHRFNQWDEYVVEYTQNGKYVKLLCEIVRGKFVVLGVSIVKYSHTPQERTVQRLFAYVAHLCGDNDKYTFENRFLYCRRTIRGTDNGFGRLNDTIRPVRIIRCCRLHTQLVYRPPSSCLM